MEGLFNNLIYTLTGQQTTTFDEYSSWEAGRGWESISGTYRRSENVLPMEEMDEEERQRVTQNIERNLVSLAKDYPDIHFILFYTTAKISLHKSIYFAIHYSFNTSHLVISSMVFY